MSILFSSSICFQPKYYFIWEFSLSLPGRIKTPFVLLNISLVTLLLLFYFLPTFLIKLKFPRDKSQPSLHSLNSQEYSSLWNIRREWPVMSDFGSNSRLETGFHLWKFLARHYTCLSLTIIRKVSRLSWGKQSVGHPENSVAIGRAGKILKHKMSVNLRFMNFEV